MCFARFSFVTTNAVSRLEANVFRYFSVLANMFRLGANVYRGLLSFTAKCVSLGFSLARMCFVCLHYFLQGMRLCCFLLLGQIPGAHVFRYYFSVQKSECISL